MEQGPIQKTVFNLQGDLHTSQGTQVVKMVFFVGCVKNLSQELASYGIKQAEDPKPLTTKLLKRRNRTPERCVASLSAKPGLSSWERSRFQP